MSSPQQDPREEQKSALPTPLELRLALRTWSRADREASGQVAIDTALDLVEAGGSLGREARSLARVGVVLRARAVARAFRSALWQVGFAVAAMLTASAVVALVATDAGGWAQMWSGGVAGTPAVSMGLVGASALLCLAAATGRPKVAALLQLVVMVLVAQWWIAAPYLGDHGIHFEPDGPMVLSGDMANVDVPLIGVVGLLLGTGFLALLAWTALDIGARASVEFREQRTRLLQLTAACAALPLLAPRLGHELVQASQLVVSSTASGLNGESQAVFLVLAICVVTFVVAAVAPRRWPALTVGACITGAALWVPFVLVASPFVWGPADQPFASTDENLRVTLGLWATMTVVAVWGAVSLIARAWRASAAATPEPDQAPRPDAGLTA